MGTQTYRVKRLFFSGSLHKEYLISAFLALLAAGIIFHFRAAVNGSEFLWQALLGIFTGLFVGYIVDAVESWHKTRFLSLVLSPIRVEEPLRVFVANLPGTSKYTQTGPGETIGIGLLYSAYSSLFSTISKTVSSSNIRVFSSKDAVKNNTVIEENQQIIMGGPRYNDLTKQLLERTNIKIHYVIDEKGSSSLRLKDRTKTWTPVTNKDFGLVIRLGRLFHVSGCQTWGVIGAATCLFSEPSAAQLVAKLRESGIDPISENYYAVISCVVPYPEEHYSIGEVRIESVEAISG